MNKRSFIGKCLVIILVNAIYLYIAYSFDFHILVFSVVLISIILVIVLSVNFKRSSDIRMGSKKLIKTLTSFYETADTLLNVFHIFFDKSFLLVSSIINIDKNQEDLNGATDMLLSTVFKENSIAEYLKKQQENVIDYESVSYKNLLVKINDFTNFSATLITMIKTTEEKLKKDVFDRLKDSELKRSYNKLANSLVIEYDGISEIIKKLFNSIIVGIKSTSKPLSEEILIIKKNVNKFVSQVNDWKNALSNEESTKNFHKIVISYNKQNKHFAEISSLIDTNYSNLKKNLIHIISMIEKINDNSLKINDIADKINVLSINASIESARAGPAGKGFKVIANEISVMSDDTKQFIDSIRTVIGETQKVTASAVADFNNECSEIRNMLTQETKGFGSFYNVLKEYNNDFEEIFSTVTDLITDITMHINNFNPVFQMHDISIQAMGNLNNLVSRFLMEKKETINKVIEDYNPDKKKELMINLLKLAENEITTDAEIESINYISKLYDLDFYIKPGKNEYGEVEMFE